MTSVRLRLLFVCIVASCGLMPTEASAQLWENTPFDPGTWNPNDWVKTPEPPKPPKFETIVVRNRGLDVVHFAYGNDHTVFGWVQVRPGQSESRTVSLSHGKAYLLVVRNGKKLKIGDRKTHYSPYHPKKRFKVRYEGRGNYSVSVDGKDLGVFHYKYLRKLGLSGAHFAEVPIRDGGRYTFTAG